MQLNLNLNELVKKLCPECKKLVITIIKEQVVQALDPEVKEKEG